LVERVCADFREKYGSIPNLEIGGPGVYHGGTWVISVRHPFVFDRRRVPSYHLGIQIRTWSGADLPTEFRDGTRRHDYVWAPPHYEQFVDRCAQDIRTQLGRPDMSRYEILSALVGRPFDDFVDSCKNSVREGKIASFGEDA
jgi:hypothetical protein